MFFEDLGFRPPDIPARLPERDEAGIWEGLGAAFTAEYMEQDSYGRKYRAETEVYEEVRERLNAVLGKEEVDKMLSERIPRRSRNPEPLKREALAAILEEHAGQFPDQFKDSPTSRETIEAETQRRYQEEYQDAIETLDYMRRGRGVTEFIGRGTAAITDPTSIAMMFTGGPAVSFGRLLAREALLGGIAEAVVLPRQFEMADYLDIEDPNVALQIALGAGFAGALVGGTKAATRAGRRQISAELSRALEYARGRNHTIPAEAPIQGAEAEAVIDAAEDALANDQLPTPAAVEGVPAEDVPWDIPPAPQRATEPPAGPDPMEEALTATLRDLEREGAETRPVLKRILSKSGDVRDTGGGILDTLRLNPAGPVAQELKARGFTTRSMPNLFRKSGRNNLDNLVASEWEEMFPGIIEATGTPMSRLTDGGYLEEQGLIDLIAGELSNSPSRLRAQQDYQRAQQELEDYLRLRDEPSETIEPLPDSDDAYAMMQGMQKIQRQVDDAIRLRGLEPLISQGKRNEIVSGIAEKGGSVDDAIQMHVDDLRAFAGGELTDAGQFDFAPFREAGLDAGDVAQDAGVVPGRGEAGAGRLEDAGAEGSGGPGGSDRGGFRSESTPEGEQLLVPGAERVQTSAAQDARAEMAARQQQSRMGTTAPQREAGPLFDDQPELGLTSEAAMDALPEDLTSSQARRTTEAGMDDLRRAISEEGDIEIYLDKDQSISLARMMEEIDDFEAMTTVVETCGVKT